MKFKKSTLFTAILLLIVVVFFVYRKFQPVSVVYNTADVVVGDIVQEISETGTVKKGEAINLNFKNSGRIEKINVSVGQTVAPGDALAELDAGDLKLKLAQAQAGLNLSQIKLDRLLNGASVQDLKIAESRVASATISSANAGQNLTDVKKTADERLANVYDDALDVLSDVYQVAFNAQNFSSLLQRTYFTPQNTDGITVYENSDLIRRKTGNIKTSVDSAMAGDRPAIESALKSAASEIGEISGSLLRIREICEKPSWRDTVAETDKTSLNNQRDYIIAAAADLTAASQAIANQTLAGEYSVNTAAAALNAANSQLQSAQDEYASLIAPPRFEDVALLKTQVAQSAAEYELLKNQVGDTVLASPVNGEVIAVNKRVGELAQPVPSDPVFVVLPSDPFQIEVDIYEEDIVKLKLNDPVRIILTAYPDKTFTGKVAFIEPADKLVSGVVYYPVKIVFDGDPVGLKPGMSVDVEIVTILGVGVVKIPENALREQQNSFFVQVLENGNVKEVPVTIGIRSKTEAEILSGLKAGDQVIIP